MHLLDGDEDLPTDFKINESFAQKYQSRKQAEEFSNLKEKYGSQIDEASSDSEEEDETGELVTPEVDAQIMKTLTLLKTKNPQVYDPNTTFFSDTQLQEAERKWKEKQKEIKSDKPMHLKDFHRSQLLANGHLDGDAPESGSHLTPVEEQERLRREVKAAFASAVDDQEDDDILTLREKSAQEKSKEEEEYKQFLLEHVGLDDKDKSLDAWRSFKDASQALDPDESFLMEYVLTRGWMDPESEKIPTYEQIVNDSEDEDAVEAAEAFENRYNFRFEEEGGQEIVTHSRAIETSLRRKDDKRKKMREKKLARKSEEKAKKDQELMRLKNLKKEELRARLLRIQEVAGGGDLMGLEEVDLEKEFDPTDFDQKMGMAFGDPYYDAEDANKKPTFDSDIEIDDILEKSEDTKKSKKKSKKKRAEVEEDFNMDADYMPTETNEVASKKGHKKQSLDAYLEEVYQLDYEDMVGDLPTRFKYRKVEGDTFGLDPVDILKAEDKDLNEFISLKKLAPYRAPEKRAKDQKSWKKHQKKKLHEFKKALKRSGKQQKEREDEERMVQKGSVTLSSDRLHSYGV